VSLTIPLRPEVQDRIREQAEREGATPEEVAARALEAQFGTASVRVKMPRLSKRETELFRIINDGFPEEFWTRYKELRAEFDARTIGEADRQELIGMTSQVDAMNVRRMESLSELAQIRGTTLPAIMQKLGIGPVQIPE
jgi:hypothetical protein